MDNWMEIVFELQTVQPSKVFFKMESSYPAILVEMKVMLDGLKLNKKIAVTNFMMMEIINFLIKKESVYELVIMGMKKKEYMISLLKSFNGK